MRGVKVICIFTKIIRIFTSLSSLWLLRVRYPDLLFSCIQGRKLETSVFTNTLTLIGIFTLLHCTSIHFCIDALQYLQILLHRFLDHSLESVWRYKPPMYICCKTNLLNLVNILLFHSILSNIIVLVITGIFLLRSLPVFSSIPSHCASTHYIPFPILLA